jgi:hypothetical protein
LQDPLSSLSQSIALSSASCHSFLVFSIHSHRFNFPSYSVAPVTSALSFLLHHLLFFFVHLSVWETPSVSRFVPPYIVRWMKNQLSRGKWHDLFAHKCVLFAYLRSGSIFCLFLHAMQQLCHLQYLHVQEAIVFCSFLFQVTGSKLCTAASYHRHTSINTWM